MSKWIGIEGRHERTIVNMDKVTFITGNALEQVEIHFDNGKVKCCQADYKKTIEELEKRLLRREKEHA